MKMRVDDTEMSSHQMQDAMSMARHPRKQSNPMPSLSPDTPWNYTNSVVKQEPMDDTRNDSGVTSESDCPSASPESDRSGNHRFHTPPPQDGDCRTDASHNHFTGSQVPFGQYAYYNGNLSMPSTSGGGDSSMSNMDISSQNVDNSSDNDLTDINKPKFNSHGKVKQHKCKHCKYVAITKLDYWEHSKIHIKGDKMLKCPKCPFVTEFKHHLEYHIMNHNGTKPYKCDSCNYTCVNNSMLRSHQKSHSKVYQYRCSDCVYETKYVHSLKLHLRKYNHQPAIVLNPDGTPNPEPVIDVYGTRRGPKSKRPSIPSSSPPLQQAPSPKIEHQHLSSLPFNPLLLNQPGMVPFPLPLLPAFPAALPNPELLQNLQFIREHFEQLTKQQNQMKSENEEGVLDLSQPPSRSSEVECEDEESMSTAFANVEVVDDSQHDSTIINGPETSNKDQNENSGQSAETQRYGFHCHDCKIGFSEEVMFRIHMGYHGFRNPFTCNMCGEENGNSVNFFLHIARPSH